MLVLVLLALHKCNVTEYWFSGPWEPMLLGCRLSSLCELPPLDLLSHLSSEGRELSWV